MESLQFSLSGLYIELARGYSLQCLRYIQYNERTLGVSGKEVQNRGCVDQKIHSGKIPWPHDGGFDSRGEATRGSSSNYQPNSYGRDGYK